jgi:hypothetical protein
VIVQVPADYEPGDEDWHLAYTDEELVEMQMEGWDEDHRGYALFVVEVLRGRASDPPEPVE